LSIPRTGAILALRDVRSVETLPGACVDDPA
jgi:hypothetical protein